MTRLLPRIAAVLPALWIATAAAIGLGDIEVRSQLNQRFAATIPLHAVAEEELGNVRVSLASHAEFERAGLERPAYLSTLRFEIKSDGAPRIEITSEEPAREPFLALLLEVSNGGSRIIREYTVFLDPPNYAAPPDPGSVFYETAAERAESAMPAAPAAAPRAPAPTEMSAEFDEPAGERDEPQPAPPAAGARTMVPAGSADGSYGPVKPNETLWSIATRLRPPAATMSQVLLALYRRNPDAFRGGINGLLRGAVLTVPSTEEILAVPAAKAHDEVMRLRGVRVAAAPRAEAVRPRPTPEPTPAPVATPEPDPEPVPTPAVVEAEPVDEAPPPTAEVPAGAPETAAQAASETEPAEDAGESVVAEVEEAPAASPEPAEAPGAAPVVAPVAAAPAPTKRPQAQPAPVREEPGLLETLLLPLVAGLVVLGGLGFLVSRLRARRKASVDRPLLSSGSAGGGVSRPAVVTKPAAAAAAAAAAAVGAVPGAAAAQKAEQPAAAGAAPDAAGSQTQQLKTQQIKTQQLKTQEMPPASAPRAQPAASTQTVEPAAASAAAVDFDLTGQFESQTVQIDLDAGDPVAEADFHLAYGLYDEAALLLRQAAEKEPDRNEIGIKLAETYFAAGRRAEFEDTARALRPKLSAGEWQKIAILGHQLAPDSPLFGDTAPAADVASADLDLDLGAGEPPAAKAPQAASAALDFSLDELEAPKLDEPQIELAADKGELLEFDLSQFDLASPPQAPAAENQARSKDDNLLDFDLDLSGFDSGEPPAAAAQAAAPAESAAPPQAREPVQAPEPLDVPAPKAAAAETPGPQEIRLDDIDLGEVSIEGDASASDAAATKLDLARAYVDMGDNEMARSLLEEVAQQGNAEQKKDARKLIEELG